LSEFIFLLRACLVVPYPSLLHVSTSELLLSYFLGQVLDLVAKESAALSQSRRASRPAKALGGLLVPSEFDFQYRSNYNKSNSGLGSAFSASSPFAAAAAASVEAFGTSSPPSFFAPAATATAATTGTAAAATPSASNAASPGLTTSPGGMFEQQLQQPLVMLGRESKREAESAKARSLELAKLAHKMRQSWDEPKQNADLKRREKMAVQQLMQRQAHEVVVDFIYGDDDDQIMYRGFLHESFVSYHFVCTALTFLCIQYEWSRLMLPAILNAVLLLLLLLFLPYFLALFLLTLLPHSQVTVVLEKGRLERGRVAAARDASLKALDAGVEGSLRALEHAARLDGRLRRCRTSTGGYILHVVVRLVRSHSCMCSSNGCV